MDESCLYKSYLDGSWRGPSLIEALRASHGLYDSSRDTYKPGWRSSTSPRAHIDNSTIAKLQKEHTFRRRENNRRAQQASRERRVQYTLDLEAKVQELVGIVQNLQDDNCKLIRQVCNLRAQNMNLRIHLSDSEASRIGSVCDYSVQIRDDSNSASCHSINDKDLEPLHQPFSAFWNLLSSYLGTECTSQDLAAALEQLKANVALGTGSTSIG